MPITSRGTAGPLNAGGTWQRAHWAAKSGWPRWAASSGARMLLRLELEKVEGEGKSELARWTHRFGERSDDEGLDAHRERDEAVLECRGAVQVDLPADRAKIRDGRGVVDPVAGDVESPRPKCGGVDSSRILKRFESQPFEIEVGVVAPFDELFAHDRAVAGGAGHRRERRPDGDLRPHRAAERSVVHPKAVVCGPFARAHRLRHVRDQLHGILKEGAPAEGNQRRLLPRYGVDLERPPSGRIALRRNSVIDKNRFRLWVPDGERPPMLIIVGGEPLLRIAVAGVDQRPFEDLTPELRIRVIALAQGDRVFVGTVALGDRLGATPRERGSEDRRRDAHGFSGYPAH